MLVLLWETMHTKHYSTLFLCADLTRDARQAMHKAAAMGQGACIKKLIEGKADLSAADLEGNTALHLAAQSGFGPVRTGIAFL